MCGVCNRVFNSKGWRSACINFKIAPDAIANDSPISFQEINFLGSKKYKLNSESLNLIQQWFPVYLRNGWLFDLLYYVSKK